MKQNNLYRFRVVLVDDEYINWNRFPIRSGMTTGMTGMRLPQLEYEIRNDGRGWIATQPTSNTKLGGQAYEIRNDDTYKETP